MTIKPGYKKTSIGIIPEDWGVKKLSDLEIKVKSGSNKKKKEKGRYKVFGSTGIIGFTDDYVYDEKLILCARVGANAGFIYDVEEKCDISDNTLILSNFNKVDQKFYQESLIQYDLNRLIFGSGQPLVTGSLLKQVKLPIPPLSEQKAIAACLSTWDKGIEKLTALIEAKKQQKKGLMQQLFNGQLTINNGQLKRVENEEDGLKGWKEVRLGKIGEFKTSSVDKISRDDEIEVKLLNYMDVYRNTHITSRINFQITSAKPSQIISSSIRMGDIMFTPSSETPDDIGHSAVVMEDLDNVLFSYHLVRFRPEKRILNKKFSGYIFNKSEILNEFSRRATGSTRYTLSIKDFKEIKTKLPPLEEQTAIADVLSTADKEIELLEQKLEAMKMQKKGLMQVLLTGEKRLINN